MGAEPVVNGDPLARLEALYERFIQQRNWQQAVQIRAQSATMAHEHGRTDLFERYFREAIDLASEHKLQRLELSQRILRFSLLLTSDLTGKTLDQLGAELKCELLPMGAADLKGALIEQLDRYGSSALATYDSLLQSGAELLDALKDSLRLASEKATAFSLAYLASQFDEDFDKLSKEQTTAAELREHIKATAANARAETVNICDSLRVEIFLLAAEFEHKRPNTASRDDLLDRAEQLSQTLPEKRTKVYLARADYARDKARDKAIDYAKLAVKASEQVSFTALKSQATTKLNELLGLGNEQTTGMPPAGTGDTERVMGFVNSATQALLERRFEEALRLAERALEYSSRPQLRRSVLRVRAIALYELGRLMEAEEDTDECISQLTRELAADLAMGAGAFDSRIPEEENLYLVKALLRTRAGRNAESWSTAERGRSGRLKREIAGSTEFPADFDSFHKWLKARKAAVLSFGPTRWGTLALTAGPDDAEPESQILDFTAHDLKALLGLDAGPESAEWDNKIIGAIPELSAALIHPLCPRIQEITREAQVLYIIPDSNLYYAPFAALTLDGTQSSRMLIDQCPLAIAPSAAVLRWCASRSSPSKSRDCLAVAVGQSEGIQFSEYLPPISALPWPGRFIKLSDEVATPQRVTAEAQRCPVVYLSCHGLIEDGTRDLMAASRLQLAGKSRLSAQDVLGWKMNAELVFLDACLAGRFRLEARTDVNGFVKAFMMAGARSLIAPLIRVDPRMASDLAESFFRAWLGGASKSKADALRTAQLAVREKYQDKQWATYFLFWDFL